MSLYAKLEVVFVSISIKSEVKKDRLGDFYAHYRAKSYCQGTALTFDCVIA